MDDMKKLVEKYKRELMELSKKAQPMPEKPLVFPEMESEQPADVVDEAAEKPHEPQIIGYSDRDIDDVFAMIAEQVDSSGVSTVTPEEAERLDDQPESGEDPNEQLAKRDFEDQSETVNPRDDIKPLQQSGAAPSVPPEPEYETLQEFTDVNNRRGTLRFRTYTARGALPVAGARIVVSRQIGGQRHVFYILTTDESGQSAILSLPAPPKELSETPDSVVTPYATYDVQINAAGYDEVMIRALPVFEGVQSVQRVALVPALGQPPETIDNTEPDLNGGV